MPHFDGIGEFGFNQLLTRRLTTPGGVVAGTVAPELFAVLTLENDRPEWGFPKGELRAGRYVSVGALAANYSALQLYVPSDRAVLATVTHIETYGAAVYLAQAVGISAGISPWSAQVTNPTDFRWGGQGSGALMETIQNTSVPANHGVIALLQSANPVFDQPIVIGPGTSLVVYSPSLNAGIDVQLSWYERGIQPGES